jgi:hypothetical protein
MVFVAPATALMTAGVAVAAPAWLAAVDTVCVRALALSIASIVKMFAVAAVVVNATERIAPSVAAVADRESSPTVPARS